MRIKPHRYWLAGTLWLAGTVAAFAGPCDRLFLNADDVSSCLQELKFHQTIQDGILAAQQKTTDAYVCMLALMLIPTHPEAAEIRDMTCVKPKATKKAAPKRHPEK